MLSSTSGWYFPVEKEDLIWQTFQIRTNSLFTFFASIPTEQTMRLLKNESPFRHGHACEIPTIVP